MSLKSVIARPLGSDARVLEARPGREDCERFSRPGAPHQVRLEALDEPFSFVGSCPMSGSATVCACQGKTTWGAMYTIRGTCGSSESKQTFGMQRGADTGCDDRMKGHL